jgi:hypothetical protein
VRGMSLNSAGKIPKLIITWSVLEEVCANLPYKLASSLLLP